MNMVQMTSYLCLIIILLVFAIELFQEQICFLIILNGTAIDINPLYNPYVTKECISPEAGIKYADRSINQEYQVNESDALYKIFIKHGWSWGGNWTNKKDYQHFEKNID